MRLERDSRHDESSRTPPKFLTDGQEWNFFLPTEQGDYSERQLYKLDILERDPQQAESSFKRYLEYDAVRSGQAIEAARKDYRNAARKRQAQKTLPDAWAKLIESEDELLIELVADKIEDLCGVRLDLDAVASFLRQRPATNASLHSTSAPIRTRRLAQPAPNAATPKSTGFELYGQRHQARNARDVMVKVLRAFAERDASASTYGSLSGTGNAAAGQEAQGVFPQPLGDRFGWENMTKAVASAYDGLPARERSGACVFTSNYGEASALNFLGGRYGLPPAISGHNTYFLWGPDGCTGEALITVGVPREEVEQGYAAVERAATITCRYCMPEENGVPIYVATKPKAPIGRLWPETKHYE